MRTSLHLLVSATAATVILAACGGGGGTVTPTTSISGAAVKGPVSGATVTVRNASSGAVLGTTTTGAGGLYSIDVQFSGDVIIEVSGGTYNDEATGNPTTLSTPMRSVLTLGGGSVTGVVTPLTTLAYTYAFGNSNTATASGFNAMATNVANQFQLNGVNLATTVPVVSGTLNPYGRVLGGVSQYLQLNNVTLKSLLTSTYSTAQWTQFSSQFNTAYLAANPGSNVTFNFDGSVFVIGGTGSGGGTGTCGVTAQGTVTANGMTVPVNLNYCVSGIAAGSCTTGNASLNQALSGAQGQSGAANLSYTFSPSCAAGALTIALK